MTLGVAFVWAVSYTHLDVYKRQVLSSEQYAEYLKAMSKFHNYSFNNAILIAMQGGNLVKGFRQWETEFDRHVKKGEKGIKILAPAPFKVKQQMEKIDPDTQKPVLGKDGQPPVSYTHLDVYKRQGQYCLPRMQK